LKCSEAVNNIHDYVSGELAGDDLSRLERHLDTCESCRSCTMEEAGFRSRVHSLLKATAPRELREKVAKMAAGGD
jgi:anti-sigma factor (TIGR02949 family)